MKSSLLSVGVLIGLSGCTGQIQYHDTDSSNEDHNVVATSQFLATVGAGSLRSGDLTLNFGTDSSVEMLIHAQIYKSPTPESSTSARCDIRMEGTFAYYAMKTIPVNASQVLELKPNSYQSSAITPVGTVQTPGEIIAANALCDEYAEALVAKKSLCEFVAEMSADHVTLDDYESILQVPLPGNDPTQSLFWVGDTSSVGLSDIERIFVRQGSRADITGSFLKKYADSTYTDSYAGASEASLTVDANLKEMRIEDRRCGLKYIIGIQSITTDGSVALLKGEISDRLLTMPVDPGSATVSGSAITKCADFQAMLDGVPTQGIEVGAIANLCVEEKCTSPDTYTDFNLGKPGTATLDSGIPDSVMFYFKSATHRQ